MRKIGFKIILAIVLCSAILLSLTGMVTFKLLSSIIINDAREELQLTTNSERLTFESETKTYVDSVKTVKGLIRSTLDINSISDLAYLGGFKEELSTQMLEIAKEVEIESLFFYFLPRIDPSEQVIVGDFKMDGNYSIDKAPVINKERLASDELQWYTGALADGVKWSDPYDKPNRGKTITYSESIRVKGKLIGVIGADISADKIINRFKAIKVSGDGVLSLFNKDLKFLAHKEHSGVELRDLDYDLHRKLMKELEEGEGSGDFTYINDGKSKELFYEELENGWVITAYINTDDMLKGYFEVEKIFFLILIVGLICATIISYIVGRSISKPIQSISKSMEELSSGEGDLTKRIKVKSKDEIFQLGENFNTFLDNLRIIVSNIKESSEKGGVIGQGLNSSSTSAAAAVFQISSNVSSIEKQIEGLNNNIINTNNEIEQIGSNIYDFKNQINEQISAVEESSASVEEMISSLSNVAAVTNKKLESTKKLVMTTQSGQALLSNTTTTFKEGVADKMGHIKDMVDVISNISERTNLLAMNAAIEAAHAGESGKGFAVVAGEIRKMAEEASSSSQAIGEIIKGIVTAIEVTDSNVDKTSIAFKEIYNEVNDIDLALNEITQNTAELASGGQEILSAVTLLKNTSARLSEGIAEIETGSGNITGAMVGVKNASSEVFCGVQEISNGVSEVSTSFDSVTNYAGDLDDESKKLLKEVNRFII